MCKVFSRPYPSSIRGTLRAYVFDWNARELSISVSPPTTGDEAEIVIAVTESSRWGYLDWQVLGLRNAEGGNVDVEQLTDKSRLELDGGPRWWTEQGRIAGSKRILVRLGRAWTGDAELTIGQNGDAGLTIGQNVELPREYLS